MHISYLKKGYSLVEVLVAIAILMLALVGPMTIASKSYQSAQYSYQQNTAFYLAQEGISAIEIISNDAALDVILGDSEDPWSWVEQSALDPCFIEDGDEGCNIDFRDETLMDNVTDCAAVSCALLYDSGATRAVYKNNSGEDTPYTRVIELSSITSDEVSVTVTVTWSSTLLGEEEQVTLTTSLFNVYK